MGAQRCLNRHNFRPEHEFRTLSWKFNNIDRNPRNHKNWKGAVIRVTQPPKGTNAHPLRTTGKRFQNRTMNKRVALFILNWMNSSPIHTNDKVW